MPKQLSGYEFISCRSKTSCRCYSHVYYLCIQLHSSASSLRNHVRTYKGKNPYTCLQCKKAFSTLSRFRKHCQTHRQLSPKCPYCDKSFVNLKEHIRTHTGERPYQCPHCEKAFTEQSSLHQARWEKHPPNTLCQNNVPGSSSWRAILTFCLLLLYVA